MSNLELTGLNPLHKAMQLAGERMTSVLCLWDLAKLLSHLQGICGQAGEGHPLWSETHREDFLLAQESVLIAVNISKPKFNGFSHRGMEKSVFIGIWTNYLGKSKQVNYTTQPSANDCQFRFWLLIPAQGPICLGQFTKPSFKGLIFTVIWGNIIVIITIVVIVIFATASLKMRRNLGAKGHSQGHTASGEPLGQDCHQILQLHSALVLSSPTLHSQWVRESCPQREKFGSWRSKKILLGLFLSLPAASRQHSSYWWGQ